MRAAVAVAGVLISLAACTSAVDGHGTTTRSGAPAASASPSAPTSPTPTPSPSVAADFSCPGVVYPDAGISFTCFAPGLTTDLDNPVWPLVEKVRVDSSGWVAETGAAHWGSLLAGNTLTTVATILRARMSDLGFYGIRPRAVTTASVDTTVAGHPAHILATTYTLELAYAKQRGTRVRVERQWIVTIDLGSGDASAWYVSLPDLVKARWPSVAQYIASIRVLA